MTDDAFGDDDARRYDLLNPWGPSDDFYLGLVRSARAVLDIGCGTGTLLHRARERGHTGRLCGLDPSAAMLGRARRRTDIEWIPGDASCLDTDAGHGAAFDLVVMTGHAFQCLTTDAALRGTLTAVRTALADGGRFAFETRNPLVRPWERWTPDRATEVTDAGITARIAHRVELPVRGDLVRFSETCSLPDGDRVRWSSLRFWDAASLTGWLRAAGLTVEEQYGDWDRSPLTDRSPEIITLAGVAARSRCGD
ncbi:class I SAM-dependent methyltransferase [Streptomyces sp. NPDC020742]|uniref:class I SAM-dependent methyltransferase n=1 Tax=unclassified Streptomyces TaxID=2593676 RepID=UPI0033D3B4E6